jgi:hypothetical protein
VEGLFTVWIFLPCLEVRQAQPDTRLGLHDLGPSPPMTPRRCGRYQEPGLAWLERQAEAAEQLLAERQAGEQN